MTRVELRRGSGVLLTVLCLAAAGAMSGVAHAQSRPQLVVQKHECRGVRALWPGFFRDYT